MKKQGGQDLVEFSLVLLLFLSLAFGIIYFGLLFKDYLSFSNWMRSAAREASVSYKKDGSYNYLETKYKNDIDAARGESGLYKLESITIEPQVETLDDGHEHDQVLVTIKLKRNEHANPIITMVSGLPFIKIKFLENPTFNYVMFDENTIEK
jgi:hypothetical protein